MRMRFLELAYLLELAVRGGDRRHVRISTAELGSAIGRSQQTASRVLMSMERNGLIARQKHDKTQRIKITPSGMDRLQDLHKLLTRVFEGCTIEGTVFTGLGEGAYYMSQAGYRAQFKDKLGFDPYPGTLNLRISTGAADEIRSKPGLKIDGFQSGGRSFGGGRCYKVRIGSDAYGVVFVPDRTHYPGDVLEVVSAGNLREKLGLRDGDLVCLTLLPSFP